jgi:hypothetical protein
LTASLSWVVSLYPAFSRHRSLAHEVSLVREAEGETGVGVRQMDALAAEQLLGSLTTQLIAVQTDLIHFPISYYFRSSKERFELSATMPCLLHLAQEGDSSDCAPGAVCGLACCEALSKTSRTRSEHVFWTYPRLRAIRFSRPTLATTLVLHPD